MDFQNLFEKSKLSFDDFLTTLKPEEKSEIVAWLTRAEQIRHDANLSAGQKRSQMNELPTSQVVLKFFQLVLNRLAGDSQLARLVLKGATGGASLFLTKRYIKAVSLALVGVQLGLPFVLTSEKFGGLIEYLKARLMNESNLNLN